MRRDTHLFTTCRAAMPTCRCSYGQRITAIVRTRAIALTTAFPSAERNRNMPFGRMKDRMRQSPALESAWRFIPHGSMQLKWCPERIAQQIITADRNDVACYRSTLELLNTTWKETFMTATSKESASGREILLVGPYGVLGTGVIDAVAANPAWRVTTATRRPAPTYRTQTPPRHISVDLMDREGTIKALSNLDTVTDLVFAAYVEKPTMAETVEPNARMLTNTLEALAARNVPLRRIVLSGGAKSYGFNLGAFNAPAKETEPRLIAPIHYHQQEDIVADWSSKNGASWTVLRPHLVMGPSLNSPMNLVTSLAAYAAMSRELGLPLRFPGRREGWNTLQETTDAELFE